MKIRIFGCLLGLLAGVCCAHGPYDSSAQLIYGSDSLEFRATLGMDGARDLLRNAGLSDGDIATALTVRGSGIPNALPAEVAAHVVAIVSGGQALKVTRVEVITDGLEASFNVAYAGSYAGEIGIRARYMQDIHALKPGAFLAMDENHNIKQQGMFSRTRAEVTVNLGTSVQPAEVAMAVPTPLATNTGISSNVAVPAATSAESSTPRWTVWLLTALGIGGLILLLGRRARR